MSVFPLGMSVYLNVLLLCLWPLSLSAYEAPEDKEDIFASRACPAFLVFDSAAFVADMTIELPCHCKPEQAHSVVWYYQKHLGSKHTKALTDFEGTSVVDSSKVGEGSDLRSRFSIRLFSLLIFRAQEKDSGHYICGTITGEFFYGYDVDIQVVLQVVFPLSFSQRDTEVPVPAKGSKKFQVFRSYWPWSTCDRCGVPGERTRIGLCYITSDYLQVRYRRKSHQVASCGSSAVPQQFRLVNSKRGAKLGVQNCHTPCPPKPAVLPERQALLDFLGFSKTASPGVPVYYHNHPANSRLILSCPGAKPQHAVAWDKGSVPLYRFQYMEGLNKSSHVFIDAGHHLHFSRVRLEDTGSYYCWLQGKLAAEIQLGVYVRLGRLRQLSDPESLFAIRAILICYTGLTAVFLLIVSVRLSWRLLKDK